MEADVKNEIPKKTSGVGEFYVTGKIFAFQPFVYNSSTGHLWIDIFKFERRAKIALYGTIT